MSYLLKACPFCGSVSLRFRCSEDSGYFWIECTKCKIEGPIVDAGDGEGFEERAKEKAARKWNSRSKSKQTCKKEKVFVAWLTD